MNRPIEQTCCREQVDRCLDEITPHLPGVVYQFLLNPDGSCSMPYASGKLMDIFGVRPEDVRNDASAIFNFVHPDDLDRLWQSTLASARQLTPWQMEFRAFDAQGEIRWLCGNGSPTRTHDGGTLWHAFLTDVTEHKLREARAGQLAMIADRSRNGVVLADAEGRIEWINAGFTRITGYELDEVRGRRPGQVLQGPDTDRATIVEMGRQLARGEGFAVEVLNYRKSGEAYWSQVEVQPLHDEHGTLTHFMGIQLDVTERHRDAQTIKQQKTLLTALLASIPDLVFFKDRDGVYLGCNPAFEQFVGRSEQQIIGGTDYDLFPAEVANAFREYDTKMVASGQARSNEEWVDYPDRSKRLLDTLKAPLIHPDHDQPIGLVGVSRDITDRKRAEQQLRESEERYSLAVRGSSDGIWDWNLQTRRVYFAPRWKQMLGLAEHEVGDHPDEWFNRIASCDLQKFQEALDDHIEGRTESFEAEVEMTHADGTPRWMLCRATAVRNQAGKATRLAGSIADITQIKRAQQKLRHLAEHDQLTELANRHRFEQLVNQSIHEVGDGAGRQGDIAVLFFDLDRFKVINDSLGHSTGDELLISVAERVKQQLRPTDAAARVGGDEFVVLLREVRDLATVQQIARRLLDVCQQPHDLDRQQVVADASIGIVFGANGYDNAEQMIRDADAAMYQAKQAGRGRFHVFDASMHDRVLERLSLENALRRARFDRDFQLLYQPIVSLETGRIDGFEALVRWQDPTRGMVRPDQFIPIAEETGLIVPLGRWILRTACRTLARWRQQYGRAALTMNVNLSRRQLLDAELVAFVNQVLVDHHLPAANVELEVTENTIMNDRDSLAGPLEKLRATGVQLAMDDFGTGHSSLSCLHDFPLDVLKIDRSFVANMSARREFTAVVQAIVTLGDHLGLNIVAEGIETQDQMVRLQALGCNQAQGYLFARPLPLAQAEQLLAESTTFASRFTSDASA